MNCFQSTLVAIVTLFGVANAIFFTGGAGAAAGTGAIALTGSGAALATGLVGGVALLKLAALKISASSRGGRRRGRRSAEDENTFALISQIEPQKCIQRLICDLATGKTKKGPNDVLINLFPVDEEAPVDSPKFEFSSAAKLGRIVKDIQTCEVRYSCPISGEDIKGLF